MKVTVIIPTYNRPDMLNNLLHQIDKEKGDYNITVQIYNDGSDLEYNLPNYNYIQYYKFKNNNGKRDYWRLVKHAFKSRKLAHYYIMLADDMTLCKGFFNKAIQQWESITDIRKACLNLLRDERVFNWTNFKRVDYHEYSLIQWNDLCFICTEKMFQLIKQVNMVERDRWDNNKLLGSGVGKQISMKILRRRHNMYQVKQSLVTHGTHKSVMNEQARKLHQITSQK